jgi:BirA family biotin operon repressor/biotin-[acetyl-CoA-carboxylase] ligase
MVVSTARDIDHPPLLKLLADGELRSGEWLAEAMGHTRAAVWKAVERLRGLGVEVLAVPRRGYRLATPIELLDGARMVEQIATGRRVHLRSLETLFEVDSTNTRLLAAAAPPKGLADVCISELQHAGRGRLGRRWIAPFGAGVAMSVAWSFSDMARSLPALSLGVGVAVARALARAGGRGIALKWPNDIWFQDRKMGGVLIELRAEAQGPAHVVIGIGVNVFLPPGARQKIEASGVAVAAVEDACDAVPSRNWVAGAILDELLSMLLVYEEQGFGAFREAWSALDALSGRSAQIVVGDRVVSGLARGVDADGALLLDSSEGMHRFVSGEASLRLIHG